MPADIAPASASTSSAGRPETPEPAAEMHALPVVIGVTGHREVRPEDRNAIAAHVHTCLKKLQGSVPSSPLVLLTPLAEGADRLVADVFLEVAAGDRRHRLVVLLPMPQEEYEEDFLSPESLDHFRGLLRRGEVIELPEPPTGRTDREARYEWAGAVIARYSHLVIALWDGERTRKTGGTGEVVNFRLDGLPERYLEYAAPLDPPECGPVLHVYTPRPGTKGTADISTEMRYPEAWGGKQAGYALERQMLSEIDAFNRDAEKLAKKQPGRIKASRRSILPPSPGIELSRSERHIAHVCAVADALAIWNQERARRMVGRLIAMGVIAVALNQVFADFLVRREVGWAYVLWLLAGFGFLWRANRKGWHRKHLNYRALAEGLRVQLFWRIADISLSVSDSYLRGQRQELLGVRQAVRFADLLALGDPPQPNPAPLLRLVHRHWVAGQLRYFVGEDRKGGDVYRSERKSRRLAWLTRIALGLGGVLLVILAVLPDRMAEDTLLDGRLIEGAEIEVRNLFLSFAALAFAAAAAAATYAEVMGLAERVRRGGKTAQFYLRADARLRALLDGENPAAQVGDARRVLVDLGKEALAENGDWVILHRGRPLEFPV